MLNYKRENALKLFKTKKHLSDSSIYIEGKDNLYVFKGYTLLFQKS